MPPRRARRRPAVEELEPRTLLSAVFTFHNDSARTGLDLAETVLSPANVNTTTFGKQFATRVDEQIFAQPLYVPGVNVTATTPASVHNVVYVATERDSVYAIDADSGAVLWRDSFLGGPPARP